MKEHLSKLTKAVPAECAESVFARSNALTQSKACTEPSCDQELVALRRPNMKHPHLIVTLATVLIASALAWPAAAGDCTGTVVGVQPLSQYDHNAGTGFLAVRSGPGARYAQTGEVYAGDMVSVYDRRGDWYAVTCMEGACTNPLWGPATPSGWVYRKFVRADGVCP
jgi:uncharacterized protein YraI